MLCLDRHSRVVLLLLIAAFLGFEIVLDPCHRLTRLLRVFAIRTRCLLPAGRYNGLSLACVWLDRYLLDGGVNLYGALA